MGPRIRLRIAAGLLLAAVLFGRSKTAAAQPDNIYNIPFNNISFQGNSFGGFSFQTPSFQSLLARSIAFQNIAFPGLYSTIEEKLRPAPAAAEGTAGNFRFAFRTRSTPAAQIAGSRAPPVATVRTARRDPFAPVSPDQPPTRRAIVRRRRPSRIVRSRGRPAVSRRWRLAASRRPFSRD